MPSRSAPWAMGTAGLRRQRVALSHPGRTVPDGLGGYTQPQVPLDPPVVYASIRPAGLRDLERLAAGTTITTQALLLVLPYHAGVTANTQATWTDRRGRAHVANVSRVIDEDQRGITQSLIAIEVTA